MHAPRACVAAKDGGGTLLAERSPGGRRVNFADSFAPGSSELGSEAEDDDGSLASSESFGGASRDPREGAAARAARRELEVAMRDMSGHLVPSLMPPDLLAARNRIASRRRKVARGARAQREAASEGALLAKLREKALRPARAARRRESAELCRRWLVAAAHARLAAATGVGDARFVALRAARENGRRREGAAARIQRVWNAYASKRVWQRFARFKAALNDGVKWQLSLHVRCWRKYRSADRCRRFLHDHRDAPRKMVATFMYKVRLIQGLAKGWIACTRTRLDLMHEMWQQVELEHLDALREKLVDDARMTSFEIPPDLTASEALLGRQINKQIHDWQRKHRDMERLVQKYRAQGRITHSAHGLRDRVPPLRADARNRALRGLLREARWDHGAVIDGWRNKVEHGDSLVPRVFDKSEAVRVMFSHPRGRVRELDEHDVFIETDLTRPTLRLWTRFAPRSMRDEIRAMYLKMHEEKHGDVVAKERAARAERAREHNGRRRHSSAAEKLLAAGSPATRRRSSVPGRKQSI